MIDYSHNHLKDDADALLKHLATVVAAGDDTEVRENALFRAGLRLMRLEKEVARMRDVILQLEDMTDEKCLRSEKVLTECSCHREYHPTHEPCCGHLEGRDPNCPFHGDGSRS